MELQRPGPEPEAGEGCGRGFGPFGGDLWAWEGLKERAQAQVPLQQQWQLQQQI